MQTTRQGWGIAFIPPELLDLCWDHIKAKGDQVGILTPKRLVIVAVQQYLSKNGYADQVNDIEARFAGKPVAKDMGMDNLTPDQRKAALILMESRNLPEAKAVEWVVKHPTEVKETFWRG